MDSENAIEVKDIKKSFKVYFDKSNLLKERVLFWKRNKYERRNVLNGISFSVKKGEAIGLIGHNGCGKSTSLKLLTKIMYPDSGTIEMKGRVSALIELGAGFHPDMSGRENIYTNAAIFGLTKKEIDKKIDDIIAFSELQEFIDNPVRTYSSGMYMRLAFAIAINVDADILLIDEILAVGDASFQQKCFNRLKEIKKEGTTIVIVSHSLGQIEEICERSIWIDKGLIRAEGSPKNVHAQYLDFMGVQQQENKAKIMEQFKKLPSARTIFEPQFWKETEGGEEADHLIKQAESTAYIVLDKGNPTSVQIRLGILAPDGKLKITVEDALPLELDRTIAGEYIFSFPLQNCSKKAEDKLRMCFTADETLNSEKVSVKAVAVEYKNEIKG
ncbi:MAG: ABC transporter ATP-binding protein [Treponema sp.]|nr:ABC transporter ATP-binding protein [Treponema sp.]